MIVSREELLGHARELASMYDMSDEAQRREYASVVVEVAARIEDDSDREWFADQLVTLARPPRRNLHHGQS